MARIFLLLIVVALFGCEKHDDLATLQTEALALENHYQPVSRRRSPSAARRSVERGGKLGASMPGGEAASREITMAGQQLAELRQLVSPGADGTSTLVKQANAAAKDGKRAELSALLDESREKLETGQRLIVEELNVAENWLLQAEAAKADAATREASAALPLDSAPEVPSVTPEAASARRYASRAPLTRATGGFGAMLGVMRIPARPEGHPAELP